jgi:hypothetical protein
VKKFMDRCRIFQYDKRKQHNTGLCQPFPITNRFWDAIIMDFVLGF